MSAPGNGPEPGPQRAIARPGLSVRRQIDNWTLRWHARLNSEFSDRTLPFVLAGVLFLILAGLALARVRSYEPSESLARYVQASWLLQEGLPVKLTIVRSLTGDPVELADLDGALVMYPLGRLAAFLPTAETLVVLQSAALAYGVLPLWRIARRLADLRVGAALAVVVGYGLFPPLHVMNLDGFHPQVLAVPVLISVAYRALSGSRVLLALGAVLAVSCSADVAVVLATFGLVLALTDRRRAGLGLLVGGVVWTIAAIHVSWLGAGDGVFVQSQSAARGASAGGTLWWVVLHPLPAAQQALGQADLAILAGFLLPLALLPLLSLRYAVAGLPLQFLYLAQDAPPSQLRGPLAAPATAFLLVATAFGLARLGRRTIERIAVPSRVSGSLVLTAVLFFAIDSPSSPYLRPWGWGGQDAADGRRAELIARVEQLGPDAAVAATADMLPRVAERRTVCPLPRASACPERPAAYLADRDLDPDTPRAAQLRAVDGDGEGLLHLVTR